MGIYRRYGDMSMILFDAEKKAVWNEMKKIDLKPCPHCGGVKLCIDDSGVFVNDARAKPESYWVVCLSCFATGGPGGPEKKAEKWNRRTP
jgi:hypothetical protein